MNPDLRAKLENNLSSYKDITAKLSTPEIYSDTTKMKSLNQELTKLEASVKLYQKYLDVEKSISETRELLIDKYTHSKEETDEVFIRNTLASL